MVGELGRRLGAGSAQAEACDYGPAGTGAQAGAGSAQAGRRLGAGSAQAEACGYGPAATARRLRPGGYDPAACAFCAFLWPPAEIRYARSRLPNSSR